MHFEPVDLYYVNKCHHTAQMDSDEDCPDLVPMAPARPSPTATSNSQKIPVTIITGFLGQCMAIGELDIHLMFWIKMMYM